MMRVSFYRHTLGEVAWLIDIAAQFEGAEIRKELERHHHAEGIEPRIGLLNGNEVVGEGYGLLVALDSDGDDGAALALISRMLEIVFSWR